MKPYFNDKFKPICNNDVPVDTLLFGTDCTKKMKELGDYTKIPIGNPRFKSQRNHSGNYYNGHLNRGALLPGRVAGTQTPTSGAGAEDTEALSGARAIPGTTSRASTKSRFTNY
jgi:hypothetical protein